MIVSEPYSKDLRWLLVQTEGGVVMMARRRTRNADVAGAVVHVWEANSLLERYACISFRLLLGDAGSHGGLSSETLGPLPAIIAQRGKRAGYT